MEKLDWLDISAESESFNRIAYLDNCLYVEYKKDKAIHKYLDVSPEIWRRIWSKEAVCPRTKGPSYGATIFNLVIDAGYKYEKIHI